MYVPQTLKTYKVYNTNSTKEDIYKPSFRKYDYESFIYLFTMFIEYREGRKVYQIDIRLTLLLAYKTYIMLMCHSRIPKGK